MYCSNKYSISLCFSIELTLIKSENNLASSKKIKEIQDEVKQIVEESVKFAEESPDLEPHELYEDVYVQKDYPFIKEFL